MGDNKVAVLLGQGFEDSEFRVPVDRLREAGFAVEVIGTKAGEELRGYKGKEKVKADRGIDEARPADYVALLIPGGQSPDHLRADHRFVDFVRELDATGRPLAAVCHGPQLLITAGLVRGRTLTAWKTIQEDLRQIGANVKDEPVVIDRNWITSRQPSDLEAFSQALIDRLEVEDEEEEPARRSAARDVSEEAQLLDQEAAAEEHQARGGQSPRGKL
jgi:protease I